MNSRGVGTIFVEKSLAFEELGQGADEDNTMGEAGSEAPSEKKLVKEEKAPEKHAAQKERKKSKIRGG
jgi:hypothetical protein